MATPQTGIFAQGTRAHRHLEFDLLPDIDTAQVLDALAPLRQPSVTAGGANIVIGFGPVLWRKIAPDATPAALGPFPDIDGLRVVPHDIWVWIHGTGEDVMLDLARAIAVVLAPIAALVSEVAGFVYKDSRDLTGFIDGTENPALDDGEVGAGGSFAIAQRWVHDLGAFHALEIEEQEGVFGRTKPDSVELDDDVKPPTAHIARVVIEEHGEELEIYRRSVPFGTVAEHGLFFVAFSADPTRFEKMLRRMFGQSGDGLRDRLTEFTTPVASANYWVPSLAALGEALG
jgi:putative iron-dependent peroxidase